MAKKIYDIKPPKVARKVENTIRSMGAAPKKRRTKAPVVRTVAEPQPAPRPTAVHHKKPRRFPLREIIIGIVIIVLLLGVYAFLKLPKADIQIWPATESFTQQDKISADKTVTAVDPVKKIIPAQYIEEVKSAAQDFPASGSASNDGKATGTITVYNKISPATPLTLKIGTHFLSDSGKYFVTLSKIVVPAMQGKTAGSISVKVQAEESGTDYNVGPSKFSVPGLSGTSYYYTVWAESSAAMAGGYAGKVKKITNADLTNAKDTLTKQLLDDAEKSLRSKLTDDQVLIDGAITRTVVSSSSNMKVDTVADSFNEAASVKVSALVFSKKDVAQLIKADITAALPDGKEYLEKTLDVQYSADSVDLQAGKESIGVKATAKRYTDIDTNSLIDLAGQKSASQIQDIINSHYGSDVAQIKVVFWPFWVHSAPSNKSRIIVELKFE